MQPISPAVTAALQAVLMLEREAFSQLHDEEHREEYHGNKRLMKWYDGLVHDTRTRRRKLLTRLFATDAIPDPNPGLPQAVDGDELAGLSRTHDLLGRLHVAYLALYRAAAPVDPVATKIARNGCQCVEATICECDVWVDKRSRMAEKVWLGTTA